MLDLHWSDEGDGDLICIRTGPGFPYIKTLVHVCCTLPGHIVLYLIKMFICTIKMQLSSSLLGFSPPECSVWITKCVAWFLFLINVYTTAVVFPNLKVVSGIMAINKSGSTQTTVAMDLYLWALQMWSLHCVVFQRRTLVLNHPLITVETGTPVGECWYSI